MKGLHCNCLGCASFIPRAALVESFRLKHSKSPNSEKVTFKSTVRENRIKTTDKIQQRDHSSFRAKRGETSAELQTQTKEEPVEQTKNIWPRNTNAPSASICKGNSRVESKSIFQAATGQLFIPQGISLLNKTFWENYSRLLKTRKKAYVAAFGCSHPKPSCLVSIQMVHLTKYNCQPQIRNNLL